MKAYDKNAVTFSPWVYLRELRAFSFPLSLLPVLIAAAAVLPISQWHYDLLAAEVAGVVLLHGLGNVLNDYFDFLSGADRAQAGNVKRPGLLLARGRITTAQVRAEALCLFFLLCIPAIYIPMTVGPGVLAFTVLGLAGAWAYTGPPFRLKGRASGELVIFLLFGPGLMLAAAYVQTGKLESRALIMSLPIGSATAAVLAGNNLRDYAEDARAHLHTLAHSWGPRGQTRFYFFLLGFAVVGIAGIGLSGGGALPALPFVAPCTLLPLLPTFSRLRKGARVADIDVRTAKAVTLLYSLVFLALIWNGPLV